MTTSARVALFEVAANPDPDWTLPFLIRLPLPTGELVLKARDSWPRTAKVYCHRAEHWPQEPEIVEQVPIRKPSTHYLGQKLLNRYTAIWADTWPPNYISWRTQDPRPPFHGPVSP